jgi:hypothetical protein
MTEVFVNAGVLAKKYDASGTDQWTTTRSCKCSSPEDRLLEELPPLAAVV